MKARTIKSILQRKHNDFVASIKDESVRKLADKNSIITGGCIVSMLLDEKINDFDYYFTNKETVLAVANYYVEQFKSNTGKAAVVEELENGRVRIKVQSKGIASDEEYAEEIDEQDESATLFDDKGLEHLKLSELKEEKANEEKESYRPIFISSNAITLTNKVQIVLRFYGDADEIHSNYDFVHCTSYWRSDNGHLSLPREALEAILTRELVYTGSKYPLASIIRTKKFIQRGWKINAGQYLKMALQLNKLDLFDVLVLEEQLTGVDFAYFSQVINSIKNKQEQDPNWKIDEMYLVEIINRIF